MAIEQVSLAKRAGYRLISGDGDGKADASILIGGSGDKFVPNINALKWASASLPGGEAWLNINFPQAVGLETPSFDGKFLSLQVRDYLHKWYDLATGELEYEFILLKKPPGNRISFAVSFSPGLEFWYQPPLANVNPDGSTWELNPSGGMRERPANVNGSYAMYWPVSGNEKKTGKLGHLYRWKATDQLGSSIWLDMTITPTGPGTATLTVTASAAWLAAATYPVVIGPTLGWTTLGASINGGPNEIQAIKFTASADGAAGSATWYIGARKSASGTWTGIAGLYADGSATPSGVSKVSSSESAGSGTVGTTATWISSTLTVPAIVNGTAYWVSKNYNTAQSQDMYDTTGATLYWKTRTYDGTMPATWPTSPGNVAQRSSCYIDYTAGGGGGNPWYAYAQQ